MGKTISFVKGKGSIAHNNRDFIANNVDKERIAWNENLIQQPLKEAYDNLFGVAVEEYNAKQKRKDRKIDDYLNKIKNSQNNEKQFYENVVQIGKMTDTGVVDQNGNLTEEAAVAKEILLEYAKTFQERNPNLYLFNAVLHMDEATPHLHLDYIPVAHGYKTGMKVRNSLTKALQEQGIEPALGKKDNETVHWQERERSYLSELCREHELEIEVLGIVRDNYSVPEYKEAMRAKESVEAEIKILQSEKLETETYMATLGSKIEEGHGEIAEQEKALVEIQQQLSEKQEKYKKCEEKINKVTDAKKAISKEIKAIRKQAVITKPLLGEDKIVKIPEMLFETMLDKYEAVGTVENIIEDYEKKISSRDTKIEKLTEKVETLNEKVKSLTDKLERCMTFISEKGLNNLFELFTNPKSFKAKLAVKKDIVKDYDEQKKNRVEQMQEKKKEHGIAI